ncbi:hypothetical protein [Natrialba sp. INN-245]|uniref:hypothetical protein n=1 Tax=Natrialba sp. INN-245 TaxID=2690967 RepID=UPI0013126481|nr:hypothetical protein [Natrialba sp. INN-245]MWV39471.1 hypothetical protein [Natrialba sp. INN-245]
MANAGGWDDIASGEEDIEDILNDESDWIDIIESQNELQQSHSTKEHADITDVEVEPGITDTSLQAVFGTDNQPSDDEVLLEGDVILNFELTRGNTPNVDREFEIQDADGDVTEIRVDGDNSPYIDVSVPAEGKSCEAESVNLVTGESTNPLDPAACDDMSIIDRSQDYESIRFDTTTASNQLDYDLVAIGDVEEADQEVPARIELTYTYESNDIVTERTTTVDLYGDTL